MPTSAGSPAGLASLADVHAHLNIPLSDTSHDVELQGFIDAAFATITYLTGPILPTAYTEVRHGGSSVIMLDNPPVLSIVSVVEYVGITAYTLTSQPLGSTSNYYGYSLDDPASGKLVRRGSSGVPMRFLGGPNSIVITYIGGQASVPADVRLAALEDIRGLYQQTQLGGRPALGGALGGEDSFSVGPMNLFPRLAMLLDGPGRTQSIA